MDLNTKNENNFSKFSIKVMYHLSLSLFQPCNRSLWTHSNSYVGPKVGWSHILKGLKVEVQFFHSCHMPQSYLITFIYSPKNTKISPIYYFGPPWIFLIGQQIFPISLSIIGHYFSKKKKNTRTCDPNIFLSKNIVLLIIWSHVT